MPITPTHLATLSLLRSGADAFSEFSASESQRLLQKSNRRFKLQQAKDAKFRGQETVAQARQRTKKTIGEQRASLAAQGVRIDAGSALDAQIEAANVGDIDVTRIKNNALREAFGFKTEASDITLQRELGRIDTFSRIGNTLLGGGLSAATNLRRGGQ